MTNCSIAGSNSLARPFSHRFGEQGEGQMYGIYILLPSNEDEIGSRKARVPEDALGEALVEADGQHAGVGKGVEDAVGIEKRRDQGFPSQAIEAFGDV